MSYRKTLILTGPVLLGSVSCNPSSNGPSGGGEEQANPVIHGKPNVILILADDMGIGDVSAFNPGAKVRTTALDALCRSGVSFTDAHSSSSMSTPSRYSILTGRYPWRTTLKSGVLTSMAAPMIAPGRRTLGDLFRDNGYTTACIGKWHLGMGWSKTGGDVDFSARISDTPVHRGFDYFYGIPASLDMSPYIYIENDRVVELPTVTFPKRTGVEMMREGPGAPGFVPEDVLPNLTRHAIDYIGQHKASDRPFFLYFPLTAPHTPVLPSAEFAGKSGISAYCDFLLMIDDMVRQIVDQLRVTGQYDDTMIVFTTDNGCASYVQTSQMEKKGHFPSYIYRGYKSDIYEGGHRLPLIVSWGSRLTGRKCTYPVSLTDFFATFADMMGATVGEFEAEDSFSFYDCLFNKVPPARQDVVMTSDDGSFALTRDNVKVIFTGSSGGSGAPASGTDPSTLPLMQIYNLAADVKEASNLYGMKKYESVEAEYKAAMKEYVESGRSNPGAPASNDTANEWKQTRIFTSGQ